MTCHPHRLDVDSDAPGCLVTIRCTTCGDYVSLGPAAKAPRRELRLAARIADICQLWPACALRSEWIAEEVGRG